MKDKTENRLALLPFHLARFASERVHACTDNKKPVCHASGVRAADYKHVQLRLDVERLTCRACRRIVDFELKNS